MTPPDDLPGGLDPVTLQQVLAAARSQVAAALWLSAGMVFAFAATACTAAGWRRPALACGLLYSATLCFLSNGHAQLLGPLGAAVAIAGLFWPGRQPARPRPAP